MKEGLLNDSDLFEELGIDNTLKRLIKNSCQQHTALRVLRLEDDNDTVSNKEDAS